MPSDPKTIQSMITSNTGLIRNSGQRIGSRTLPTDRVAVQQSIEGGKLEGVSQLVNLQVGTPDIYFYLHLSESSQVKTQDTEHATAHVKILKPGQRYVLHVAAGKNSDPRVSCGPVQIVAALELVLSAKNVDGSTGAITLPAEAWTVSLDEILDWKRDYGFILPPNYPPGEVVFELTFREAGRSDFIFRLAARIVCTIEGTVAAEAVERQQTKLQELHIDATAAASGNTIFLHIESSEPGRVRLHCLNSSKPPISTKSLLQPREGLAEFNDEKKPITFWLNTIHTFSENNPRDFNIWLKEIISDLAKADQTCYVVIVENIDSNIPWELLELDEFYFLGAYAVITRWIVVQSFGYSPKLELGDKQVMGSLTAYVDTCDHRSTEDECSALAAFNPSYWYTPEQLEEGLASGSAKNIIYLRFRGIFTVGDEPGSNLAALSNPDNQVMDLARVRLLEPSSNRPFFFVNSYHSGRVLRNERGACGFASAMLKKIASAYIGTMGLVPPQYATSIALRLLQVASERPAGVSPARLLWELRKEIVGEVQNNKNNAEAWKKLLYTFMYVYYGNPNTMIKLAGREIENTVT